MLAYPLKGHAHSLRVLLDLDLTEEVQGASVTRTTFHHLLLVCQVHLYLEELTLQQQSMLWSHPDCCNALYVAPPSKMVRKLQLVQNWPKMHIQNVCEGSLWATICNGQVHANSCRKVSSLCCFKYCSLCHKADFGVVWKVSKKQ